jgi:glycine/D-amino acid oxidase-like deaminating enzyme
MADSLAAVDVVVVGAGIMGSSIAFLLAKSGRRVAIVDERGPVGGISGRTFGQIRQHYSNELLIEMAKYGFDTIQNWSERVGYGDPGYARMGYILMVVEDQIEACRRNVELGQSLGVDTTFVGPDQIKAIEPLLVTEGLAGGAYEPDGGYIDVTRMVLSCLTGAQDNGLSAFHGLRVESIDMVGDRTVGVTTSEGWIESPVVVTATGAWARDLLQPVDVDVPITRRRLDMVTLEQATGRPRIGTCVTDGNSNVVLCPDMGAQMLAVAYPKEMPVVEDPLGGPSDREHKAHMKRFTKAFSERLPDYVDAKVVKHISGAYDVTPDFHPMLGWAPGLYLAVGMSGHGPKLSPSIGAIVAADVLGTTSPFDAHQLRPERFAEDDLMVGAYGISARA